jgi:DNA-binding transcriptional regulator PaaX
MKPFDARGLVDALHGATGEDIDGWIRTKDLLPLIGVTTLAGIRTPLERIVKAGFAEMKRITKKNLAYRLSPKFKTWDDAHNAAIELDRFKAPAGWVTLTQYSRKLRRTVRGIQYRIDGMDIDGIGMAGIGT